MKNILSYKTKMLIQDLIIPHQNIINLMLNTSEIEYFKEEIKTLNISSDYKHVLQLIIDDYSNYLKRK